MDILDKLEEKVKVAISKIGELQNKIHELETENESLRNTEQRRSDKIENLLLELEDLTASPQISREDTIHGSNENSMQLNSDIQRPEYEVDSELR